MRKSHSLSIIALAVLSIFIVGCSKQSVENKAAVNSVEKKSSEPCGCGLPVPEAPKSTKKPAQTSDAKPDAKPEAKPVAETPKPSKPADKPAPKPAVTVKAAKDTHAVKPAAKPAATPRLVDLGGENCVPCKMMKPILDGLSTDYSGKLKVEVYDIQKDEKAAKKYPVRMIPTQIFFDANGKEIARHQGFISREDILATFEKHGINFEKE